MKKRKPFFFEPDLEIKKELVTVYSRSISHNTIINAFGLHTLKKDMLVQ